MADSIVLFMKMRILSSEPLIETTHNFIDSSICGEIILKFKKTLIPSKTYDGSKNVKHPGRTSESNFLSKNDSIIKKILKKLVNHKELSLNKFEDPQIALYKIGDEYVPHSDAFDLREKKIPKHIKILGQRKMTSLIYLNTPKEGGETCFPFLDLKIKPIKGKLLFFHNCMKGTNEMHPYSMHQSLPVTKGEKWILTIWSREKDISN